MRVTHQQIEAVARRIADEFRPRRVVLLGSQAAGNAPEDSDVDLLVVLDFVGPACVTAARIRAALPLEVPIDVIARAPDDIERRYSLGDPLIRQAIDRGVVLYAAAA